MSTLLPTTEPQQERPSDIWAYVSPSRLNVWLACPLKFKLRYIDGIRTPPTINLFLGKQVHAGLECYYRHRQLGITLAAEEVTTRMLGGWDRAVTEAGMAFDTVATEASLKSRAEQLLVAYLDQLPENERLPIAVEATMEVPLVDPQTGEDLGIPLLGVVDLILDEVPGPTIVDFKTSSKSSPPFAVTHEIQLSCYSYLFRALSGLEEGGLEVRSIIKTKRPKIETHRYSARSAHHQQRLFAVLREYLDCLDSGAFNFRPGWGCGMCDYLCNHCSSWPG